MTILYFVCGFIVTAINYYFEKQSGSLGNHLAILIFWPAIILLLLAVGIMKLSELRIPARKRKSPAITQPQVVQRKTNKQEDAKFTFDGAL